MTTALLLKVKVMEWPRMSPDLNPIEHMWGILKRKVEKHYVSNIQQLRDVIMEEWKRMPATTCAALINSMPMAMRIKAVLDTEGSQMLFYVWFEFTSWLRGVGQGKGAWDRFLTIWAWDSCAFCQWDQWLLRDWTFILQMTLSWPDVDSLGLLPSDVCFLWCFVST